MEPFEYPEDRGEIFGEVNEEEQSLMYSIMDFEQLIDRYGVNLIFARMRNDQFMKIAEWFSDINTTSECAALLKPPKG